MRKPLIPILLLAVLGAGCASLGTGVMSSAELTRALEERGLEPSEVVVPFRLSLEMRAWLDGRRTVGKEARERLDALLGRVLMDPDRETFRYQTGYTATASEVFASRQANCLGFTFLFVGLAREMGIPVYFLRVEDIEAFERDGDLIIASGHVAAAYDDGPKRLIYDFAATRREGYRSIEPLSDLEAIGLYYTNRGAELLRERRVVEARSMLEVAVRLAPELADAWVNLGVARRRTGDPEGAETAYREALARDASTVAAYQNLAALLRLQGDSEKARELMAVTDRLANRNPYSYLALGDLSLRWGEIDEARRYFRRAYRLDRNNAETRAAMGQLALLEERFDEADRWLERARLVDPGGERVERLAERLDAVRGKGKEL